MTRSVNPEDWHGPEPLPNPIDVPGLGRIYSRTAAFYDSVVAEKQAGGKLEALRQLRRRQGERFLEVGAGTGWAFARVIAESGARDALGVDVATGMLEVARQRLGELTDATAPRPSLLLADARRLPFVDASFDCLLNTYTFEVLPTADIPAVLDECLRVLKRGGRIVVVNLTEGETPDDAAMTDDWKRRYRDDPESFGGARPLRLHPMLEAHGYVNVRRTYVGGDWPSEVLFAERPSQR